MFGADLTSFDHSQSLDTDKVPKQPKILRVISLLLSTWSAFPLDRSLLH